MSYGYGGGAYQLLTHDSDIVLLATCGDMVEAVGLRSMLEAEGIQALVHGEHHRAQLGFLGAYVDLRVMVRADALADARELLEEAKYAEHIPAENDTAVDDLDDVSVQRWRERAGAEPAVEDEVDSAPALRSTAIPVVAGLVLGLGIGHLYGGRFKTGFVLAVLQLLSIAYLSVAYMLPVLIVLRALDAVGGARAIGEHNAASAAAAAPRT